MADDLQTLRSRYPDWLITREATGRLVAVHRTEQPDPQREKALLLTRVTADTVEQLDPKLLVQRCLREQLPGGYPVARGVR